MKKKQVRWNRLLANICIFIGIVCMIYPFFSEICWQNRTSSVITTYENVSQKLGSEQYQNLMAQAEAYNAYLVKAQKNLSDPFEERADTESKFYYERLLSTDHSGVMGYLEIPKIKVALPIYHGTSGSILEKGIGHLEGTSLPIGGESTHSVLTGHTGLGQAKLLSDLSELEEEDVFFVNVLGKSRCYQVFNIETVLPEDTDSLQIESGEDYVTLVTCTPYGMNTHRLLVHGRRIDEESEKKVMNEKGDTDRTDSKWEQKYKEAICMGVCLVACIILLSSQGFFKGIGICLFVGGIVLFLSPELMQEIQKAKVQVLVQTYEQMEKCQSQHKEESHLYQKMAAYNQVIYQERQKGLQSQDNDQIELNENKEWAKDIIGILEIPAMHQILPIYFGASQSHMADGVAIIQETSFPIGGNNTNCVIAGHRGYNHSKTFFKDIERLSLGDNIYIKNPWDELTYEVEKIDIVNPDDIDAIKIQDEKDMITLLTCHPYGAHGKYRYLVYCRRTNKNDRNVVNEKKDWGYSDHIVASDGKIYASSFETIQNETYFRWICAAILIAVIAITEMNDILRKRRSE